MSKYAFPLASTRAVWGVETKLFEADPSAAALAPASKASKAASGGGVALLGRARLVSKASDLEPTRGKNTLNVSGSWRYVSAYDHASFLTRTSAVPGGELGLSTEGVECGLSNQGGQWNSRDGRTYHVYVTLAAT